MNLFQRLLVAPATLGLLAPISANASEVNLNVISNYYSESELEINSDTFKPLSTNDSLLISGGEGLVDSSDHGPDDSFSSTTSASFSVDMVLGAVDGATNADDTLDAQNLNATYGYQIDLSTSFTGEDSLDVSIDAGSSGTTLGELDLNSGGDTLKVDGVSYTFPLGDKITAFVGDNTDGSTLYSTACVYGGVTNTLDDCGNASSAMAAEFGTAAGASFDIGNGFTGAIGYEGQGSDQVGLMTKEGTDSYGGQLSYAADQYGASVTYNITETSSTAETTYWGLNGYWTPSETGSMPSISVGYETGDPSAASAKDTTHYFIGLQWDEIGPGTLGVAAGTADPVEENANELMMYEAFYSYPINDGLTLTPLIFIEEKAAGTDDLTGVAVKASFSF
jgi:hypothetical protein